jgi:hypothetical protein
MFDCVKPKNLKQKSYEFLTGKKNRQHARDFAGTPYAQRVIFVPQCMRNIEKCRAKEEGGYYICAECGFCKIAPISKKAKELGYKALFILKGGRIIEKIMKDLKPRAVLGIACFYEGAEGMKICEKNSVIVQFVPLTKDGCVATDVNLDEVLKIL